MTLPVKDETFRQWMRRLRILASNNLSPEVFQDEIWKEFYDEKLSPQEAWMTWLDDMLGKA